MPSPGKTGLVSDEQLKTQREYMEKVRRLHTKPPLAFVHTYGCQQNVSDSERMMGMLLEMGYEFTDDRDEADFILFNTCAVRENAENTVFGNVGNIKKLKEQKRSLLIALAGCMVQQEHIQEKIKISYPYVGLVFGTHDIYRLPELLYGTLTSKKRIIYSLTASDGVIAEGLPVYRKKAVSGNIPVMYGCNNFCSYCVVPYVRGRERSRLSAEIIKEARELLRRGFNEITLLGQNVNSYGKGLDEDVDFAELLKKLNDLPGDFTVKFMTSHPKDITDKLIDTIASCEKVSKHLHLPVQAGNDRVLKAMNRGYTKGGYLELAEKIRRKIPGVSLTSDIIVGFPGETYEEFQDTLDLIKKVRFDSLFTFIYSKRRGTPAERMDDPVTAEEKSRWFAELLRTQEKIEGKI